MGKGTRFRPFNCVRIVNFLMWAGNFYSSWIILNICKWFLSAQKLFFSKSLQCLIVIVKCACNVKFSFLIGENQKLVPQWSYKVNSLVILKTIGGKTSFSNKNQTMMYFVSSFWVFSGIWLKGDILVWEVLRQNILAPLVMVCESAPCKIF